MSATTAADRLADALERLSRGETRTRPVSISLPGPLADALTQLSEAGVVHSTSAAATEALTQWAYNRLLRLSLDEIYQDSPDLRPSPERVRELADRLGVSVQGPPGEVA
jgi:transglutaminase-like putative cysteine protease